MFVPSYECVDKCSPQPWVGQDTSKTAEQKALGRFSVEGKRAVITGGGRGIGLDAAFALLEHGAVAIMLIDINGFFLEQAQRELEALYPQRRIVSKMVDVSRPEQILDAVDYFARCIGDIDLVFANAGIVNCKSATNHTPTEWNKVMDVNSSGVFYTAKYFGEQMIKQGHGGSIVLTASIAGHRALFPQPQIAYNASKAAVKSMAASFAAEWAQYGIRVNSISPGYMDTALNASEGLNVHKEVWFSKTPMARMGARGELNGAILLLLSSAGSFITGTDICVDGGITAIA
ncbi:probable NADP-dependent mannitol dehydrogenase [Trichomonascus vanleenenianus]|uniref:putative NADP-dependent mannitol dehydrogenase n=1 Tax=Trichomonascus vanleenenianus TaxID=2268995 RepID=UPI003EC9F807